MGQKRPMILQGTNISNHDLVRSLPNGDLAPNSNNYCQPSFIINAHSLTFICNHFYSS